MAQFATITGWGKCMPPAILTNADLATFLDTDDEWIRSRTGINERRVSHVSLGEMSFVAASRALAGAGLKAGDLDLIVFGTCSMDEQVPNMASWLQARLGASGAGAMDVNTACTSFLYGLTTASRDDQVGHRAKRAGDRRRADLVAHGLDQPQCFRTLRRRLRGGRAPGNRARGRRAGGPPRLLWRCARHPPGSRHGHGLRQPGLGARRHRVGVRRAGDLQARRRRHEQGLRDRAQGARTRSPTTCTSSCRTRRTCASSRRS